MSLIGLVLAGVAAWQAGQAKAAAESARQAMTRVDAVATLGGAIQSMEEIKRHLQGGSWAIVPDRCSSVCRALTFIRNANLDLSERSKTSLTGTVQQLRRMEHTVVEHLQLERERDARQDESSSDAQQREPDAVALYKFSSNQTEKLIELLPHLKTEAGS